MDLPTKKKISFQFEAKYTRLILTLNREFIHNLQTTAASNIYISRPLKGQPAQIDHNVYFLQLKE